MKILIVDDNIDLADSLSDMLMAEGYDVDVVYNGNDALDVFGKTDYDLVLLDAKLPDVSGIRVYRQLVRLKPESRIIVMTGFRVEQLLAYGCGNDIMVMRKPVFGELILQNINKLDKGIILIADNGSSVTEELRNMLADVGKSVSVVTGTADLFEKSMLSDDVIILDTNKTVLFDLDVCEKLKQSGYTGTVVMLAKEQSIPSDDALKSLEVTGCIFKPFSPQELIDAIEMRTD